MPIGPGLVTHPDYLQHAPGNWPESPERLQAVLERFRAAGVAERTQPIRPRPATRRELELVHTPQYLTSLHQLAHRNGGYLDLDTIVTARSYEVAVLAAGGCLAAVDAACSAEGPVASLCLVRPPGHHAMPGRGMGFCLLNNVALAAAHALAEHSLRRVLVVDWDLHHGNGTEAVFYSRSDVLYQSVHQSPCYPGTGWLTDVGEGEGEGYNVNLPFPPGAGDEAFEQAFTRLFVPIARDYAPELVLVSSGHDAHFADPLGSMQVTARGYRRLAAHLVDLARETAGGRIVAIMEGGYNEAALGWSLLAVLDALGGLELDLGDVEGAPGPGEGMPPEARQRIEQVRKLHAKHWPSLSS
ncbi:MAG: histone deacetylase [bacterium]|nr:histone deacetylase [bacterium]